MQRAFCGSLIVVIIAGLAGCNGDGQKKPASTGETPQSPDKPNGGDVPAVRPSNNQGGKADPHTPPPARAMATTRELVFKLASAGLPEQSRWKCDPKLVDVNGDGHVDLAGHPRLERGPVIWLGNGAGQWTKPDSQPEFGALSCGGNLHFADVNHDQHLDLIVADHCSGLYVWLGDGKGNWQRVAGPVNASDQRAYAPEDEENIPSGFEDVGVGDINGDGHLDLVGGGTDPDAGMSVFVGDGSGAKWTLTKTDLPNRGWVTRLKLVDLNGDGHLDVFSSWFEGPGVWLGDGKGNFKDASKGLPRTENAGIFHGIGVADFNEDGRQDLAIMNWYNGVLVYYQQENGNWFFPEDPFPLMQGGGYGLATGDINGDGHADILAGGRLTTELGYIYGVFVLLGDGRGKFKYLAESGLPERGMEFNFGVSLGDVNKDGLLDVVVGSGGEVATGTDGRTAPVIAPRMPVWLGQRRSK